MLTAPNYMQLSAWFERRSHHNFDGRLPGPSNQPPVHGQHPYLEFDIYPKPNLLGVGGGLHPPVGLTNRGEARILVGIQPPGAVAPHAGVGRWFYTADHYTSFIEL